MFDKNPESYAFITYLWVFVLATFGGLVAYLKKLKGGKKWSWIDFLIELITSAFVGITTFYLCESLGLSQVFTAAIVGISGHFSSKSITLFSKILDKTLGRLAK